MAKDTAEESRGISVSWLKKHDYFIGWRSGTITWTSGWDESKSSIGITVDTEAKTIRFVYTQTSWDDEKRDMDYSFNLDTTPCHFGGHRYWFICGLSVAGRYCGRRVGVLYKSPGSWYWGCRHCHNLCYDSQKENRRSALFGFIDLELKAEKLEEKIKRRFYAGRPTRKQRRLDKLLGRRLSYASLLIKNKEL